MERCQEHMVADGQVDRSKKMDGVVERTRRCDTCGSLFKTFEMTDDKLARQQGEHDERMNELKRELEYYKEVVGNMKALYEAERILKAAVKRELEVGNGEGV